MLREVKTTQRLSRFLGFRVDGTGTAAIQEGDKSGATLVDNGTGDYTLTFKHPFARIPVVTASVETADCIAQLKVVSKTVVQINLFDATDGTTAKDGIFHLLVLGFDSIDQT
jgi:hypothetical protein